jgi:predicted negative regulator of RcsB-dependent stress response
VDAAQDKEQIMHDFMTFLNGNGLWVMIIAVVAIGSWFKFREKELRSQQELRAKEMEHLQKMRELELELEKTKQRSSPGQGT